MKHQYRPYDKRQIITCKSTGEIVTGDRYLSSRHWKAMADRIFDKYKGECQKCHSTISKDQANIHHITYKRLGNESEKDLILYCKGCNTNVHNAKRRAKQDNKSIHSYIRLLDDNGKEELLQWLKEKLDVEEIK